MLIEYNGECSSSAGRAKWRKKCNRFQFVGMLLICVVSEIARKGNSPQASSNQRKKKSFLIKKIICTHFLGYFHAWTGQEHAKCRCLPSSCWAQKWIFLLHLDATFLGTDKNNSQHISIFAFIFDISIIWRSQFCCWWRWFFSQFYFTWSFHFVCCCFVSQCASFCMWQFGIQLMCGDVQHFFTLGVYMRCTAQLARAHTISTQIQKGKKEWDKTTFSHMSSFAICSALPQENVFVTFM